MLRWLYDWASVGDANANRQKSLLDRSGLFHCAVVAASRLVEGVNHRRSHERVLVSELWPTGHPRSWRGCVALGSPYLVRSIADA
jgi:hypothetical protein